LPYCQPAANVRAALVGRALPACHTACRWYPLR
jgi:hypothetical protein